MLHDIGDHTFNNHYEERTPRPDDLLVSIVGNAMLMHRENNEVHLPRMGEADIQADACIYLFSIDDTSYFLAWRAIPIAFGSHEYIDLADFRWISPRPTHLACEVAWQLYHWYDRNRFCGRCGTQTVFDHAERMMRCPQCGNMIFPKISPGIIVGIIDGDHLLLTKYAGRGFASWALVAGFTEIGETLEDTVRREVMEEVGLRVKHVTYYGNQPWPRSSSHLVGFFAQLDGDATPRVDHSELACGEWIRFNEVPNVPDHYSLTNEMMCFFAAHHDHLECMIDFERK